MTTGTETEPKKLGWKFDKLIKETPLFERYFRIDDLLSDAMRKSGYEDESRMLGGSWWESDKIDAITPKIWQIIDAEGIDEKKFLNALRALVHTATGGRDHRLIFMHCYKKYIMRAIAVAIS